MLWVSENGVMVGAVGLAQKIVCEIAQQLGYRTSSHYCADLHADPLLIAARLRRQLPESEPTLI